MQFTIFSFFMAVAWSSIAILIIYFIVRKRYFITMFGVTSIVLLYLLCVFRMLVALEVPFTREISQIWLWNYVYRYLWLEKIEILEWNVFRSDVLLLIWIGIFLLKWSAFVIKYIRGVSKINSIKMVNDNYIEIVLEDVLRSIGKRVEIRVLLSPDIKSPIGAGIRKKTIFLPEQTYSEKELYYILLHEVTHFQNKDIPMKLLIQLVCCIFWWNPVVYLLRRDLEQVLEIRCDLAICESLEKDEKVDYLSTILAIIKSQDSQETVEQYEYVAIVGSNVEENLVERFSIVADSRKRKSKWGTKVVLYAGLVLSVLLSYSFVLQPAYSAPLEEIETDDDTYEITPKNSYIISQGDGTYLWVVNIQGDEFEEIIDQDMVENLVADGFKIKVVRQSEKD